MREILNCMEEINIDDFEYCMLVEDTPHYSQKFKMYIPKSMGGFEISPAKTWKESVNDGIFQNAPECKIKADKTIPCQNYVTVDRHFDSDFSYRAEPNDRVRKGVRFMIQSMYGNLKDLYVDRVL